MKRIHHKAIYMALFLCYVNTLSSQYIYTTHRDTSDIYKCVISLYRTNIFTCEKEELFNFFKLDYNGVYKVDVDDANNVLFFSYNLMLNYAMIDLSNPSHAVDLTRDIGGWGSPDTGINYQTAYHHPSGTLYLFWRKFDPELKYETGQIDSCAIVDPETGKNIKAFESFFDIYSASFSRDGKRLYTWESIPLKEPRTRKIVITIIDARTAEIIESFTESDIEPEAKKVDLIGLYDKGDTNKFLVKVLYGEGDNKKEFVFVYNMDNKQKSRRILNSIDGYYKLSSDDSKIIIGDLREKKTGEYDSRVHILDVKWPKDDNDNEIMHIEDGIDIHVDPVKKGKEYSLRTFASNPDLLLFYYHNEPFEKSYLIRLSDGKILRKGK